MQIDSTGIIAIISALSLAVVHIITAIQNGRRVDRVAVDLAAKTEDVAARLASQTKQVADAATGKLNHITELTNSTLTSLKTELAQARREINELRSALGLPPRSPEE